MVVDGNHSWVVLLEMMAQRLFGSLSRDKKIISSYGANVPHYSSNVQDEELYVSFLCCKIALDKHTAACHYNLYILTSSHLNCAFLLSLLWPLGMLQTTKFTSQISQEPAEMTQED